MAQVCAVVTLGDEPIEFTCKYIEIFSFSDKVLHPNVSELRSFVQQFPNNSALQEAYVRTLFQTTEQAKSSGLFFRLGIVSEVLRFPKGLQETDLCAIGDILSEKLSKFWKFCGLPIPAGNTEFSVVKLIESWILAFPLTADPTVMPRDFVAGLVQNNLEFAVSQFGYEFSGWSGFNPIKRNSILGVERAQNIRHFTFRGTDLLSDEDLELLLLSYPEIRSLALLDCPALTPRILKSISACTTLKRLLLSGLDWAEVLLEFPTAPSPRGLEDPHMFSSSFVEPEVPVPPPALSTLVIKNFSNLVYSVNLPKLKHLHLIDCPLLRSFTFESRTSYASLKTLVLSGTPELDPVPLASYLLPNSEALSSTLPTASLERLVLHERKFLNVLTTLWDKPSLLWGFIRKWNLLPNLFSELGNSEKAEFHLVYTFCWDFIPDSEYFEIVKVIAENGPRDNCKNFPELLDRVAEKNLGDLRKEFPKILDAREYDPYLLEAYEGVLFQFFSADPTSIASELIDNLKHHSEPSEREAVAHRTVTELGNAFGGLSAKTVDSELMDQHQLRSLITSLSGQRVSS
jgi:hypothetical protein